MQINVDPTEYWAARVHTCKKERLHLINDLRSGRLFAVFRVVESEVQNITRSGFPTNCFSPMRIDLGSNCFIQDPTFRKAARSKYCWARQFCSRKNGLYSRNPEKREFWSFNFISRFSDIAMSLAWVWVSNRTSKRTLGQREEERVPCNYIHCKSGQAFTQLQHIAFSSAFIENIQKNQDFLNNAGN